jgi:integrase
VLTPVIGMRQGQPSIAEALALVSSRLDADPRIRLATSERYMADIARFMAALEAGRVTLLRDVTFDHVRRFIEEPISRNHLWADPKPKTMNSRRAAVRRFFAEARRLGLVDHDPTAGIEVPRIASVSSRPLMDEEEQRCRLACRETLDATRLPAAWALGQAFATASDLASTRVRDVDLDAGRVWLAGNANRRARWSDLTSWGVERLGARIHHLDERPGARLVYDGSRGAGTPGRAWCDAIYEVLALGGLAGQPAIHPSSLAGWAARKVFLRTGRIDDVARGLGLRSLDRAAAVIGWDWR